MINFTQFLCKVQKNEVFRQIILIPIWIKLVQNFRPLSSTMTTRVDCLFDLDLDHKMSNFVGTLAFPTIDKSCTKIYRSSLNGAFFFKRRNQIVKRN